MPTSTEDTQYVKQLRRLAYSSAGLGLLGIGVAALSWNRNSGAEGIVLAAAGFLGVTGGIMRFYLGAVASDPRSQLASPVFEKGFWGVFIAALLGLIIAAAIMGVNNGTLFMYLSLAISMVGVVLLCLWLRVSQRRWVSSGGK